MPKRGPRYTPEEAEARIPGVARSLALEAVGLVIALERRGPYSHDVERRVWAITGEAGFLSSLCHVLWRNRALEKAEAPGAE